MYLRLFGYLFPDSFTCPKMSPNRPLDQIVFLRLLRFPIHRNHWLSYSIFCMPNLLSLKRGLKTFVYTFRHRVLIRSSTEESKNQTHRYSTDKRDIYKDFVEHVDPLSVIYVDGTTWLETCARIYYRTDFDTWAKQAKELSLTRATSANEKKANIWALCNNY